MSPYDTGYQAYLDGKRVEDNPYVETTFERGEWARGWRGAEDDES